MKVSLERKKRESSLRPLTEKEIQQKLYGSYHPEASGGASEEMKAEVIEPSVFSGVLSTLEKASSYVLNFPGKFFPLFLSFSRSLVTKVVSPWGGGLLLIACLFFAVSSLNAFRAKAMKRPRPVAPVATVALRHPENQPKREGTEELEIPTPPSPKELPVRQTKKPYVIQLVTYARESDAQKLTNQILQENLPAFVQPLSRSHGKTYYPVFLGRFETFREAQAKLGEFRKKPFLKDFPDSFVRTL